MSAAAPAPNAVVDWTALQLAQDEVLRLRDLRQLDELAFKRLWRQAETACGTELQLLDTIAMLALDPAWLPAPFRPSH